MSDFLVLLYFLQGLLTLYLLVMHVWHILSNIYSMKIVITRQNHDILSFKFIYYTWIFYQIG